MKLQRKDAGGRKSGQHPNHPQSEPSPVQSAVGSAHQEADSTATKEHAKKDHHLSYSPRVPGISQHQYDDDVSFLADEDCWEGWRSILACSLVAVETDS